MFSGATIGTAVGGGIATGSMPSPDAILLGGVANAIAGGIANRIFPMRGVTTVATTRFAPRTARTLFSGSPNARAFLGASLFGGYWAAYLPEVALGHSSSGGAGSGGK